MIRALQFAIIFTLVATEAYAQAANEPAPSLEACFQSARDADMVCYDPANGPVQRLDCLERARQAQLQCLEQIPPGQSAAPSAPHLPHATVQSRLPGAVAPETPKTGSLPEVPPGALRAFGPATVSGTVPTDTQSTAKHPPATTTVVVPDKPTGAISGAPIAPKSNWVISETTSPIDYSPLVAAAIYSTSNVIAAPTTLIFRCRGLRTELQIQTEGTWRASRATEFQVDYQINDQPSISRPWTLSSNGKTASYTDDAAELLRSLPEGGLLKIKVSERPGVSHEATFQIAGLEVVRKKIAAVCKWPSAEENKLSSKR